MNFAFFFLIYFTCRIKNPTILCYFQQKFENLKNCNLQMKLVLSYVIFTVCERLESNAFVSVRNGHKPIMTDQINLISLVRLGLIFDNSPRIKKAYKKQKLKPFFLFLFSFSRRIKLRRPTKLTSMFFFLLKKKKIKKAYKNLAQQIMTSKPLFNELSPNQTQMNSHQYPFLLTHAWG